MLDVFYLSYNEPFADEHYEKLLDVAPHAKRVHGIKGIFNGHKECARQAMTENFYVIDADAILEPDFEFDFEPEWHQQDHIFVWRARNPVNGLIYGVGGVKLFPTKIIREANNWLIDFTTSVAGKFKPMSQISNTNGFNYSPFGAYKSAFRECTKLASKVIHNQKDEETNTRLHIWCTVGKDKLYGKYAIQGAIAGKAWGEKYKNNPKMLDKINDFEWLQQNFAGEN
ncbi:MAG: hypothetical protein CXT73_01785 [Methanobacteriota archaeon]|jgi:hypothetical protein|nr:MAG: hypothetical protein CXT73_01785 [Euryarchaeota archaeon]